MSFRRNWRRYSLGLWIMCNYTASKVEMRALSAGLTGLTGAVELQYTINHDRVTKYIYISSD